MTVIYFDQIGGNPFFSPKRLPAVGKNENDITPGSFYYSPDDKILYVELMDKSNPNNNFMEASDKTILFYVRKKRFIFVDGINFIHCNTTAKFKNGWPAVNISGSKCIIKNLNVSWCDFTGLGGTGDSIKVSNCTSNYNGDSGMTFGGHNIFIENCITNYNNYRNFNINYHAGGMKNLHLEYSIIKKHTSISNNGPGIWFDLGCKNITVEDCMVLSNKGEGIFYEISDSATIKNNIVYDNSMKGIYISASNDCGVYNNLIDNNTSGIIIAGVPRNSSTLFNNSVENNIIINSRAIDIMIEPDGNDSKNNQSDYNLFYNENNRMRFKRGYSTSFPNIEQWHIITKNDGHSIVADPKIQISSDTSFTIFENSPVFGRGKVIPDVTKDMKGKKRNTQSFDIGPYCK